MKHEDNYLAEAVKQMNNRYAERCNAAGLNFMACAFEATGAICKEVTPQMERSLNRNEIGCRRLNGRSKEKYPRKQPSDKYKSLPLFFIQFRVVLK
jgi:hypothetical protein